MGTNLAEEGEDLTTCSTCFFEYDEEERRPKLLPCSHSSCLLCLEVSNTVQDD